MPIEPPTTIARHHQALYAINQASIALKPYRKNGTIPTGTPSILPSLDQLILNLERAYKDILQCQDRLLFH